MANTHTYFKAPTNTLSPQQANYSESNLGRTCKVGLYQPNSLDIGDMHGLVWEWCEDAYDGSARVLRGGSWYYSGEVCRAANWYSYDPEYSFNDLGVRLARVPFR